jgi:MtN3 and saliva related transmembrane protein
MIYKIYADIVASLAIILSTLAFIPQAYKIYLSNMTNDLDFYTFEVLSIISFLWILWGILINKYTFNNFTIIIFSLIQFILVVYITIKIYKNKYMDTI